jgi:hypothetical protein
LGEKLAQREKPVGDRPSKKTPDFVSGVSAEADDRLPTIAELGFSHKQSSRWQAMASAPEDDFEKHIAEVKRRGEELTSAGVLRLAKRLEVEAKRARNSMMVEPAQNNGQEPNGEDAGIGAHTIDFEAEHAAVDRRAVEAQMPPEIIVGLEVVASVGEAEELPETPQPEMHQDNVGPGESSQDLARPAGLAIDPRHDPYRDGANVDEVQRGAEVVHTLQILLRLPARPRRRRSALAACRGKGKRCRKGNTRPPK